MLSETMGKILNIPRFWGPLITVLFTVVYHFAASYFGFTVTYGWLWLFLIAGGFIGGLRASLLCAGWVTLYAILTLPGDLSRVIQIAVISVVGAWLIGYLRQRERRLQKVFDEVFNGNVARMESAMGASRTLLKEWNNLTVTEQKEQVQQINHYLAHLLTSVVGYRQMREEQERVEEWYSNPENIQKIKAFEQVKDIQLAIEEADASTLKTLKEAIEQAETKL